MASARISAYSATRRTWAPVCGSLASMARSSDSSAADAKRSARSRTRRSRTMATPATRPVAIPAMSVTGRITVAIRARTELRSGIGEQATGNGEIAKAGLADRVGEPGHGEQSGLFPSPVSLAPVPRPAVALSPFPVPRSLVPPLMESEKPPILRSEALHREAGDGLLSRALSGGVPSALQGLTAVFGMGTGVAPAL